METQMALTPEPEPRGDLSGSYPNPTTGPAARATDPETSHKAAASVTDVTAKQAAVLDVLRHYGPLTDEQIRNYHRAKAYPWQSDSGLRTRRKELVELGKVEPVTMLGGDVFKRPTVSGRESIVWRAVADTSSP